MSNTNFDQPTSKPVWIDGLVTVLVVSLLSVRWWLPTEGGSEGTTLTVAWIGIVLAAVSATLQWIWRGPAVGWSVADVGVACLVGGHLLGGSVVFLTEGDRRTAASLIVEWASLGSFWWLVRQMVQSASGRGTLVAVIPVMGIGLAGLGLHQHFVEFP